MSAILMHYIHPWGVRADTKIPFAYNKKGYIYHFYMSVFKVCLSKYFRWLRLDWVLELLSPSLANWPCFNIQF